MGITYDWFNEEKTAILCRVTGEWAWEDYHQATDAMRDMMRTVDHVVDIITNLEKTHMPPGNPLPHFQRMSKNRPENAGRMVLVGGNKFFEAIGKVFSRVYQPRTGRGMLYAASVEEAATLLAEQRPQKAATPDDAEA